jgi:hypothetical protein
MLKFLIKTTLVLTDLTVQLADGLIDLATRLLTRRGADGGRAADRVVEAGAAVVEVMVSYVASSRSSS